VACNKRGKIPSAKRGKTCDRWQDPSAGKPVTGGMRGKRQLGQLGMVLVSSDELTVGSKLGNQDHIIVTWLTRFPPVATVTCLDF